MAPRLRLLACLLATTPLIGGCSLFTFPSVEATLTTIELTPPVSSLPAGVTRQLAATAMFSDGTTRDVTAEVEWTSSDPAVAEVSTDGAVTSVAAGVTTIVAAKPGTAVSGTVTLTVTAAPLVSIAVTPAAASVPLGAAVQLTATGTYADATTQDLTRSVDWSSSVSAVAALSSTGETAGRASTGTVGTTDVTATHRASGISGSTTLTVTGAQLVSIAVTPAAPSVPLGVAKGFTATGTYTNGTTQDLTAAVTWSSSNGDVASVSNAVASRGVASTLATGTTTIQATDPTTHLAGTATLTVTAAQLASISVTPTAPSVPLGVSRQLTATGTYTNGTTQDLTAAVTWSSSTGTVASVSNAAGSKGLATSAATGTTTIQALDPTTRISGSTPLTVTDAQLVSIAVTPATPSVPLGVPKQLTATGTYTNGSTQDLTAVVTWSSSAAAVASVSNAAGSNGLVSTASTGSTTLQATDPASHVSGSTTLTVTAAQLVSIAVTPASPTLPLGVARQLTATGRYTNGTEQDLTELVTWSSSDAAVASVSNAAGTQGVASTAATGVTTIRAADAASGVSGTANLTVTPAELVSISVAPATAEVVVGGAQQLTATGTYSDGSEQDLTASVTWSALDSAVAEVSNASDSNGLATGVAPGVTSVEGRDPATGIGGSAALTVSAAPEPPPASGPTP
jgi:hypothetical protein